MFSSVVRTLSAAVVGSWGITSGALAAPAATPARGESSQLVASEAARTESPGVPGDDKMAGTTEPGRADAPSIPPGSPLRIEWQGPPACGSNTALESETKRLLGEVAETSGVLVHARASTLADGRYRIDLELFGAVQGERSLESRKCSEAVQAAAVVLALAVNAEALLPEEEKQPPDPLEPPEPPPPPPQEPPRPPREDKRTLRGFVLFGARISSGLAPFPHYGIAASGGLEWKALRIFLGGAYEPTTNHQLDPTGSFKLLLASGSLGACLSAPTPASLPVRGCAALSFNHLGVTPDGLEPNRSRSAFIVAPQFGAEAGVRLSDNLALLLGASVQIPVTNPAFTVDGPEDTVTVGHDVDVGGVFFLGPEVRF